MLSVKNTQNRLAQSRLDSGNGSYCKIIADFSDDHLGISAITTHLS